MRNVSKLIDSEAVGRDPLRGFIANEVFELKSGPCPVYKVDGFDTYKFSEMGVTSQFLEHASIYYDKYTNPAHFIQLYKMAIEAKGIMPNVRGRKVLDIGTGGGNSIFALIELLGPLQALGVDISEPLLRLCSETATRDYGDSSLSLVCADLYKIDVNPNSVDLVSGSSILHHMVDPGPIVDLALHALKPGGHAIFTEPFENGHGVLRGIYASILAMIAEGCPPIPDKFLQYMKDYIADFEARKGVGDIRDYTQFLDDKWFFTSSWFRQRSACDIAIIPTHGGTEMFWRQFSVAARFHNGADANTLPAWARRIFASFDETFSAPQKQEIAFTGIIIMTKPL